MRYLLNKTELKTINYILSLNENNQINEGILDRIKNMASKGLLTASVITSLMSNPTFAQEYKNLDSNTKSKIENLVKTDKTTENIVIDFTSTFQSGKYLLGEGEKQAFQDKLNQINEFIKKTGNDKFKLVIHSSESQVPMKDMKKGELSRLRANEMKKLINSYLLKTDAVFKVVVNSEIGKTNFDEVEANKIGVDKARDLKKYTNEQFVKIELNANDFDTPCSFSYKPVSGTILDKSSDYSIDKKFDVTNQVGSGDIILKPGGIPDRVQIIADGVVIADSGYFVDNNTSKDNNASMYKYLPRYVAELTKVSKDNSSAAKSSVAKKLNIVHFDKFEDLVKYCLSDNAKSSGFDAFSQKGDCLDTNLKFLKDLWGKDGFKGHRDFVFYDKEPLETKTPLKLKFSLDGKIKNVTVKVFSPIGKTDYQLDGICKLVQ